MFHTYYYHTFIYTFNLIKKANQKKDVELVAGLQVLQIHETNFGNDNEFAYLCCLSTVWI